MQALEKAIESQRKRKNKRELLADEYHYETKILVAFYKGLQGGKGKVHGDTLGGKIKTNVERVLLGVGGRFLQREEWSKKLKKREVTMEDGRITYEERFYIGIEVGGRTLSWLIQTHCKQQNECKGPGKKGAEFQQAGGQHAREAKGDQEVEYDHFKTNGVLQKGN